MLLAVQPQMETHQRSRMSDGQCTACSIVCMLSAEQLRVLAGPVCASALHILLACFAGGATMHLQALCKLKLLLGPAR